VELDLEAAQKSSGSYITKNNKPDSGQNDEPIAEEAADPDEDIEEGEDGLDQGHEDEELGPVADLTHLLLLNLLLHLIHQGVKAVVHVPTHTLKNKNPWNRNEEEWD
jgi:hypothetical protein